MMDGGLTTQACAVRENELLCRSGEGCVVGAGCVFIGQACIL